MYSAFTFGPLFVQPCHSFLCLLSMSSLVYQGSHMGNWISQELSTR